ncbi:hypothetical protein Scep_024437 [Stephania cephalantha]|uniref:Uncharacterized protein n=1 Tax=Stephania cephalantha TaxID=152367 RepID=A0AAP0HX46_9MAGN
MAGRRCGSSSGAGEKQAMTPRGGASGGARQRRDGALPDRSIPDETQQQWTTRHDFDEALLRDGLLAKKTRGVCRGEVLNHILVLGSNDFNLIANILI